MDQYRVMLDTPKQAIRWSGFTQRDNHAGHILGVAELVDAQGITMPGYTLQIEVKAAAEVNRCLYLFSIMHLHNKKRLRAYQLEVAPQNKRTHIGNPNIYGPHEHVGEEDEPTPVVSDDVNCDNWESVVRWFFTRVSVTPFPIENPLCQV